MSSKLIPVSVDTKKHLVTIINQEMGLSMFADNVLLHGVHYISFETSPTSSTDSFPVTKCVLKVDKDKFISNHTGFRIFYEAEQ